KFCAYPGAVFVKALLVESSTLVEGYGVGRSGKLHEHSADIERADRRTSASQHCDCLLKRRGHCGLDFRHGFRHSQRKILCPARGMSHRFPEREHVNWCLGEKPERV